jgi:hypothetical protein
LGYSFGVYEIHPTEAVEFTRVNERPTVPGDFGRTLKVASLNVLNYFSTLDNGGPICGPSGDLDCRGADNAEEFTRQRTKIINAIVAMDADVIGLMEIENNPTDDALRDLVSGLNDVAGAGTYGYIPTGPIGTDAIKVAFIYKPAVSCLSVHMLSLTHRWTRFLLTPKTARHWLRPSNTHSQAKGSPWRSIILSRKAHLAMISGIRIRGMVRETAIRPAQGLQMPWSTGWELTQQTAVTRISS